MIIGRFYTLKDETAIEVRVITAIEGQRQIERIESSFNLIPDDSMETLANQMIDMHSDFTENNLKETDANRIFEANCGRGARFTFMESEMKTTSKFPGQLLICIEIGHRVL